MIAITRRVFWTGLTATIVLPVGAYVARTMWSWRVSRDDPEALKAFLSGYFADIRAIDDPASIGKEYLAAHPGDADAERLISELMGPERVTTIWKLTRRLNKRRRADFEREEFLFVQGWLLSRTEARALALLSLL